MFLILAVVLFIAYFAVIFAFHVTAWFVHLIILFAIISVVMHFISGRRSA